MTITGRHIILFSTAAMLCLASCTKQKQEQAAQAYVDYAAELVEQHRYEAALRQIDSVHSLYPKQVAQRRQAKALKDSVVYLQVQQTFAYCDSLLQQLLPQADELLKQFRFEKNDAYEDHGQYVYRNLQTGWNTNRCFLQAYVSDDRKTLVKSYYYGAKPIRQTSVALQAAEQEIEMQGQNHAFEVEGWHEILTLSDDQALEVLNFISSHLSDRIRVTARGSSKAAYYLTDNEKQALDQTYRLGLLMRDINQLEEQLRIASQRIEHFESRTKEGPK
ncbi:MAG: hypothetical protein IJT12_02825 [Paludibacteraceae bacterium]|nr:hypothetical protein [Paludibacteraceae bacterium]